MATIFRLISFMVFGSLISQIFGAYRIMDQLLPKDYDKHELPMIDGKPVEVQVAMHVINFRLFKEKDLSFTMDIFLYLSWRDLRLRINWLNRPDLTLTSEWMKEIWKPDVYFKNGISGNLNSAMFSTGYFVLNRTNEHKCCNVFMAARVTVEFLCDFDFKNYPHDTHRCDLDLMSLSTRNESMSLYWDRFRVSNRVYNPDFVLSNPAHRDCTTKYPVGTFSCVRGSIRLTRLVRRHFARQYTPTFLIVCTSFVGFWIPTTSHPARVTILVVSLLALITQQVQSQPVRSIETISYNVWANTCIALVFFALIEFALAIVWHEKNKDKKPQEQPTPKFTDQPDGSVQKKTFWSTIVQLYHDSCINVNMVDLYSRLIFPLFFFCFIIFYSIYVHFREG